MRTMISALALLPALALLTAFTPEPTSPEGAFKGARAVLVDGEDLDAQIRVTGTGDATGLAILLSQSTGSNGVRAAAPVAEPGRACFRVSVILLTRQNRDLPDDELTTEHAHFTYWLYPPVEEDLAVVMSGSDAFAPGQHLIPRFGEYGLPVDGARGDAASCARRPAP